MTTIHNSIAPWLTVKSTTAAIDFYKSAFDAKEVYRMEGSDNDLVVRLSIDGAEFWVSNGSPETPLGGENVRMILTVSDPDVLFLKAVKAGASEVFPVGEDHGWRLGRLEDPFGLNWEIGRPLTV
jgi:PhnB protein